MVRTHGVAEQRVDRPLARELILPLKGGRHDERRGNDRHHPPRRRVRHVTGALVLDPEVQRLQAVAQCLLDPLHPIGVGRSRWGRGHDQGVSVAAGAAGTAAANWYWPPAGCASLSRYATTSTVLPESVVNGTPVSTTT